MSPEICHEVACQPPARRRWRLWLAGAASVLTSAGLLAACGSSPSPSALSHPSSTAAKTSRWHTVFVDNFVGPSGAMLSSKTWRYFSGYTFGLAPFEPNAQFASLNGHGQLVVVARHTTSGWEAAQVGTRQAFMPKPGQSLEISARLKLPAGGHGFWPAFWAMPTSALTNPSTEPAAGEIDIAETIDNYNWVAQILHCGPSKTSGPCKEPSPRISHLHKFPTPAGEAGWNTYSAVWHNAGTSSSIDFFINGQRQLVVTEQEIGARYWNEAFGHPYFLLFDLAVGGWAGKPNQASASTTSMTVKYVRVSVS